MVKVGVNCRVQFERCRSMGITHVNFTFRAYPMPQNMKTMQGNSCVCVQVATEGIVNRASIRHEHHLLATSHCPSKMFVIVILCMEPRKKKMAVGIFSVMRGVLIGAENIIRTKVQLTDKRSRHCVFNPVIIIYCSE